MTTIRPGARRVALSAALTILLLTSFGVTADQVEMQNGDRYFGRLLTFTNDTLVLQPGATNIMQQVQQQFLSGASPQANQKFNEMAGGLLTGKLNVADIRAEAAAAADQLRKLKHDSGDDAGALEGYLTILDNFLRETAPTAGSLTNSAAPLRKTKDAPAKEDD